MNETSEEIGKDLMKRARKIVQKKHELFINVIIYIAANIMLTIIWFITGIEFFWPIFCILGWGFGLGVMAIDVFCFVNNKGYSDKVEQEYQKLKHHSSKDIR